MTQNDLKYHLHLGDVHATELTTIQRGHDDLSDATKRTHSLYGGPTKYKHTFNSRKCQLLVTVYSHTAISSPSMPFKWSPSPQSTYIHGYTHLPTQKGRKAELACSLEVYISSILDVYLTRRRMAQKLAFPATNFRVGRLFQHHGPRRRTTGKPSGLRLHPP